MSATGRESSRDRDGRQHSVDSGRISVPMWDSSDPERAPPPLPLYPSSGPATKANTSAGIAAAAKQFIETARESAPLSSYTSNNSPQGSPDRSRIKGAPHKRMQSLQTGTGSVKDLRSYLDSNRSPERSPERPTSRAGTFISYGRTTSIEDFSSPPPERSSTPTPVAKDLLKDTPSLRHTSRPSPRPLLGENTPPSATMLALQTMQVPDPPLSDATNTPNASSGTRAHTTYDCSSQLLNLTTIATNLQKEMTQLSRRSKDNATDLISLKAATNSRDEDIRRSLRGLASSVETLRTDVVRTLDKPEDMTVDYEILDTLKAGMAGLRAEMDKPLDATIDYEVLEALKDDMSDLRAVLEKPLDIHVNHEILETLKDGIASLRAALDKPLDMAVNYEILDTLKDGIAGLRAALDKPADMPVDQEMLENLQDGMADLRAALDKPLNTAVDHEILQTIKDGIAGLRAEMDKPLDRTVDYEILDTLKDGMTGLRAALDKPVDHEMLLDTLKDGIAGLRAEIDKPVDHEILETLKDGVADLRAALDKPLNMTVNYEILDTLKDGIAGLRAEMDKLTGGGIRPKTPQGGMIVLAEGAEVGRELPADSRPAPPVPAVQRADFERIEILLAQLQIKIEAMDHTVQDLPTHHTPHPAEGTVVKDDLAALEGILGELQDNVATIAAREAPEGAARKEDTDAIETLLRNTKAQLEEFVLPDPANAVTKDHMDEVQAVVRITNEAIESLADRVENSVASKADIAVVEVLASDIKLAMDELKEKLHSTSEEEKPEVMTKADLDVLGVLCTEIKARVLEINFPDAEQMTTKSDIEQLQGLISDFRESHDKMRDSYETDIAVTAKAFDDRKNEYEDTLAQIAQVRILLDEAKIELLEKMADGDTGLNALGETMKSIEERSSNDAVIIEVQEVMEKIKEEFERAHDSIEAIKVDHAQSVESSLEKQSEHKDAVVGELSEKLDILFDGIMVKYDDAQHAAEEKAKAMEEQAALQHELFDNTRSMADDLKLSIDTLGTALTSFIGDLPATVEKMAEESKTVFAQVELTHSKLEETAEGLRGEHAVTRDEVSKVLAALDGVQGDLTEHNPRFMVTLEEVRALIGQHYDHSQRTATAANEHAEAVRELQDQLKAGFEAQTDGLKTHSEELKTVLPALMPPSMEPAPTAERYDDGAVHEKLDRLMGHVEEAADRSTQLERLDQIHERVLATAAEVSAFVSAQNRQITADHETKEKEAEEIALLLERRLERKDQLEADITVLNEEKESLQHAVDALKAEKDALAAHKTRLHADASSLETALHIRRDELHAMDHKAATIEKRIMDGVMQQSRMLLLAKASTTKPPSPTKQKPFKGRDLRVPSNASTTSAYTVTSSVPSAVKANHALVMKSSRPAGLQRNAPNTAERRIMSLNQIPHNVPTGAHAFTSERLGLVATGLQSMKRSHSVKTTPFMRKGSWTPAVGGKRNMGSTAHNKENSLAEGEEEDSLDGADHAREGEEFGSETGTERRRSSYLSASGTDGTYATGSYLEGETPLSEGGRRGSYYGNQSEMTFDTGSYLTGSELDRRTSLGSSADGVVGGAHEAIDEREEEDAAQRPQPLRLEAQSKRMYAPPSDSGLGTDLPTALGSGGEEYFR